MDEDDVSFSSCSEDLVAILDFAEVDLVDDGVEVVMWMGGRLIMLFSSFVFKSWVDFIFCTSSSIGCTNSRSNLSISAVAISVVDLLGCNNIGPEIILSYKSWVYI